MRIRSPWLSQLARIAAARFLHLWMATLRHQRRQLADRALPRLGQPRAIYITWHEYLLLPLQACAHSNTCFLLSRSSDGQLLSAALRHFGITEVSGSVAKGGVEALRGLIRAAKQQNLGLIPDGPRGPRRHIKPGLIYLAARTGLPIVPMGFAYDRPWRLKSWDRFALPRPFSRAASVAGAPITVPADATKDSMEHYRWVVERRLEEAIQLAEDLAYTGVWRKPDSSAVAPLEESSLDQTHFSDMSAMRMAA